MTLRLKVRIQPGSSRARAPGTAVASAGKCPCRLLPGPCGAGLAPTCRPGEGCPGAAQHRAASGDGSSPRGAALGPTIHLENASAAAAAPCTSPRDIYLLLPMELATAHPAHPGPAALTALPHHDPSPAVTLRCGGGCATLPGLGAGPRLPTYLIPVLATEQP